MNFIHFKPELLAAIRPQAQVTAMREAILMGAFAVAGFDPDFKFDEGSIAQIETFLDERHRHRVLKWGAGRGGYELTRIVTSAGLPSSSKKQIELYDSYLNTIGLLYSYCMANALGGTMMLNQEGTLVIQPPGDGMAYYPAGKVFKFLRNGKEDSPVGFMNIVRSQGATKPMVNLLRQKMLDQLEEHGAVPASYRWQQWHDQETGELTRIVMVDDDGKELYGIDVAQTYTEGIGRAPDEVIARFVASEEGQAILRRIYSSADEHGKFTRGDLMDAAWQLNAVRNYLKGAKA